MALQVAVLQRQPGEQRVRFEPVERAWLTVLLHRLRGCPREFQTGTRPADLWDNPGYPTMSRRVAEVRHFGSGGPQWSGGIRVAQRGRHGTSLTA